MSTDNYQLTTSYPCTGSAEQLWQTLIDCESFPSYMDGVKEVSVTEDAGDTRTTSWLVELKGSEMEWDQDDTIVSEARKWTFSQFDGDLAHYEGYWQVTEDAGQVALELNVEFDIGLPLVAEMIHPAVAKALEGYQQAIVEQSVR